MHHHDGNSSGTIFMKSKTSQSIVPVQFAVSGNCSEAAADFVDLVVNLSHHIIQSHNHESKKWPPLEQVQETIIVWIGSREFRLSLDLLVEAKISQAEYRELVELLEGTFLHLSRARGFEVFEAVWLRGQKRGITFQAWWTLYNVLDGTVGKCGKRAGISVIEKEL
ncbi:MAG: hypothetical protein CL912_11735 [Deltaproteobacteria bacterium]|nr:hypothetical protein [Deltaproteobacteria bacterium]